MGTNTAVSEMAGTLIGSEVLKIAGEIAALKATGRDITNFTVGDFDPKQFPIPAALSKYLVEALGRGETNYPPSDGMAPLRKAVADFYRREAKLPFQTENILVAGGARPLIYVTFKTLVNPGDTVIYPVPSWNNNHYCHLSGAHGVPVTGTADEGFLPTAAQIAPHISKARLVCLNSPLNPTGTAYKASRLKEIAELVVHENERRQSKGERPLYLMWDQIYWKLTFGDTEHCDPVSLVPAVAPWTIFIDGVSKYFCGTGLRVGWSAWPKHLMPTASALLGHIGAWAPRAEQVATAQFLDDATALNDFVARTRVAVAARLDALHGGLSRLRAEGLAFEAIRPQGGIYLSVRVGRGERSNEAVRQSLLEGAGVAAVPFQAFGLPDNSGWMRFSVGAVSVEAIAPAIERIAQWATRTGLKL